MVNAVVAGALQVQPETCAPWVKSSPRRLRPPVPVSFPHRVLPYADIFPQEGRPLYFNNS